MRGVTRVIQGHVLPARTSELIPGEQTLDRATQRGIHWSKIIQQARLNEATISARVHSAAAAVGHPATVPTRYWSTPSVRSLVGRTTSALSPCITQDNRHQTLASRVPVYSSVTWAGASGWDARLGIEARLCGRHQNLTASDGPTVLRRWKSALSAVHVDDQNVQAMAETSGTKRVAEVAYHCVDDVTEAARVVTRLMELDHLTHACDTEVADIDVSRSPLGQGRVICLSVYSGPELDVGSGPGAAIWIDTTKEGVLEIFKPWLERETARKVWHNYSFDRHVLYNEGVDVRGFGGDTMHMARLWDASRTAGYSLAALTEELTIQGKVSMKELFGKPSVLKSGKEGKQIVLPDVADVQENVSLRDSWIRYSCYDAKGTWLLHEVLLSKLKAMPWQEPGSSMADYYEQYWRPFGELLTQMERTGVHVDIGTKLPEAERRARIDRDNAERTFRRWAAMHCSGAWYMNEGSATQIRTLLFGGQSCKTPVALVPVRQVFRVSRSDFETLQAMRLRDLDNDTRPVAIMAAARAAVDALPPSLFHQMKVAELRQELKYRNLDTRGKKSDLIERIEEARTREQGGCSSQEAAAVDVAAPILQRMSIDQLQEEITRRNLQPRDDIRHPTSTASVKVDLPSHIAYEKLRVIDLKAELRKRGMPVSGRKDALIQRLTQNDMATKEELSRTCIPSDSPKADGMMQPAEDRLKTSLVECLALAIAFGDESALDTVHEGAVSPRAHAEQELLKLSRDQLIAQLQANDLATAGPTPSLVARLADAISAASCDPNDPGQAESVGLPVIARSEAAYGVPSSGVVAAGPSWVEFELTSLGLKNEAFTKSGLPATDAASLRNLAGDPLGVIPRYGTAYDAFGGSDNGHAACVALDALCKMSAIDTMLGTFILPLQDLADDNHRIHCSLNLNTTTGRLSSRAPNLQNQPALQKDAYKIRDAFTAEEGNALVVADYGQLELRILAHITACESMIEAFASGGCFHSRTAMGMFDHVRTAVENGDVLLEWDYSKGKPTAPLLKDVYGAERQRGKTLNFSIAYGKTPHGLSKDWGVSISEAESMLEAWYGDRPEVKRWQQATIQRALVTGSTRTLLGRYRPLPGISSSSRAVRGHMERAAINTPIQGGAADIMTLAMIKLHGSAELKKMGFRLLLQVHDEVMLEGPHEHAEAALAEVVACMERPFDKSLPSLLVDLAVDAKTAKTWYDAK